MRHWFFHPVVFYPLVILIAAVAILVSLEPLNWARKPAPVAGRHVGASLIWTGEGFNSPDTSPEQRMTVMRDAWGKAQTLHIAVLPNQPSPTPAEQGTRVLLTPGDAALMDGKPVTVDVTYNSLTLNNASALAVSIQGIGPAEWVIHDAPLPPTGPLTFELPPQMAPEAIGLRAISNETDQARGFEITNIKVSPHD